MVCPPEPLVASEEAGSPGSALLLTGTRKQLELLHVCSGELGAGASVPACSRLRPLAPCKAVVPAPSGQKADAEERRLSVERAATHGQILLARLDRNDYACERTVPEEVGARPCSRLVASFAARRYD